MLKPGAIGQAGPEAQPSLTLQQEGVDAKMPIPWAELARAERNSLLVAAQQYTYKQLPILNAEHNRYFFRRWSQAEYLAYLVEALRLHSGGGAVSRVLFVLAMLIFAIWGWASHSWVPLGVGAAVGVIVGWKMRGGRR